MQIDKNRIELTKLNAGDNNSGKYKVKTIFDSAVYIKKLAVYLSKFYYLVS